MHSSGMEPSRLDHRQSGGRSPDAVLLADVGGTKARFAWLVAGRLGEVTSLSVAEYSGFEDALGAFMSSRPEGAAIGDALLAVAGPVQDRSVTLTNSGWYIDADDLCRQFGFERVELINDHAALALSLPHFTSADVRPLGQGHPRPDAPAAVVGPGTGLGVAALIHKGGLEGVLQTEGGHVTFAGADRREDAVIQFLRDRTRHVSAERILSGPGLVNLYEAISAVDGLIGPPRTASEITAAAVARSCPLSQATLSMFSAMLGTFAGNVALTFGARGGVYIAGGIAPKIADYLSRSPFRDRFEAKGRFRSYLAAVPSYVITRQDPAFAGLQACCAPRSSSP
ncbi:MAG: glucokinase [Rhodomicrobiaceae bacterium]